MSKEYSTQNAAFQMGLYYAGRADISNLNIDDLIKNNTISEVKNLTIGQFYSELESTKFIKFLNVNDEEVILGSAKFRNGYDLWLVNKENGMTFRLS